MMMWLITEEGSVEALQWLLRLLMSEVVEGTQNHPISQDQPQK